MLKKILISFFMIGAVMMPFGVSASNGKLDADSIITCDGKQYGQHNGHWHQSTADGKASGSNLGEDWKCQDPPERVAVELVKCVDGDTAHFSLNGKEITARFLAVDTPETKHPTIGVQPFGPEASEYTCNMLTKANSIYIEYDNSSTKTDKYDRHLVWVYADGNMIQKGLVQQGLAKVAYLYGDYKYTAELQQLELTAKSKGINIWADEIMSNSAPTNEGDNEKEVTTTPSTGDNITDNVNCITNGGCVVTAQERTFIEEVFDFIKGLSAIELCIFVVIAFIVVVLIIKSVKYLLNNKIISKKDMEKIAKDIYKKRK